MLDLKSKYKMIVMEIRLKCSDYKYNIEIKEVIKNFFDFNIGSVVTDVFSITSSIELKAFMLLYTTVKATNLELSKTFDQEKLNKSNLIVIGGNIDLEIKSFLEQDIALKKEFFQDPLGHNLDYLRRSYLLFRRYLGILDIQVPINFEFEYYLKFRDNLAAEFQSDKEKYKELLEYFNNPILDQNSSMFKRFDYYITIKSYYTNLLQADNGSTETLSDLYIDPLFKVLQKNFKNKTQYEDFSRLSDTKITVHNFLNEYFLKGLQYFDLKENYNMLFILGQPGQGKTSMCYKIIYDWLENSLGIPQDPIFFVKIRDLVAKDFISAPFEEINSYLNININFIEANCILILDGLDEAYMGGGITDNDLRNLYERLNKTAKVNRKLKIILTSRQNYLKTDESCLDGSLVLQLTPLTNKQIVEYANKFKIFYPNNNFIKKVKKIMSDKDYKHIQELLRQAVLIYFIAISDIDINDKDSRAIIYKKIFNTLSKRIWDSKGQLDYIKVKIKDNHEFYEKYLREFIRSVAFEVYQSPNLYITLNNLIELDATKNFTKKCFIEDFGNSQEKIKEVSKYLLISFYFQESHKNNNSETAIEFFHNSLWEYLTAEYLWEENKKLLLREDEDNELISISKEDYFTFLSKMIGDKSLNFNIYENLVDIIRNENEVIKQKIANQSIKLFEQLLKDDFLLHYRRQENKNLTAIEKTKAIFELFWTYFYKSNLANNKLIIIDKQIERHLFLFTDLFSSEYDYNNVKFIYGSYLRKSSDMNNFKQVQFEGDLGGGHFHSDSFINSLFYRCEIDCVFIKCKFENVDFIEVTFYKEDLFKECIFINCRFIDTDVPTEKFLEIINRNNLVDSAFKKHHIEEEHDARFAPTVTFWVRYNDGF